MGCFIRAVPCCRLLPEACPRLSADTTCFCPCSLPCCCQDAAAAEVRLAQAEEDLSSNAETLARQQQQLAGLKQQTTAAQAGLADAQAALARVKQQVQVRTMYVACICVYDTCTSV